MGVVQCLFQSFVRWLEAGWSNSSFSLLAPGMFSGARSTWSSAMLVILYLPRGVLSLTSKQLPVFFWNRSIWHLHMYLHHRKFFFWEVSLRRDLSHLFILLSAKSTFLGTVLLFLGNLNIHPLFHSIGFEKRAFYTWKNNHVMHPSIPAELSPAQPPPPPPRATAGHLPALSVPGVGHLQILRCPGAEHLQTAGPTPSFWHARGFLTEYNYTEHFTGKASRLAHFSRKEKNCRGL